MTDDGWRDEKDDEDDVMLELFADNARFSLVNAAQDLLKCCGYMNQEEVEVLERLLKVFDPKPEIFTPEDPDIAF